ncbi:MAG: CbiX/SirB N-terminal domain-containing protein [Betaproteobacteria bacterium]|jgi:sirohydrochlorin cobaltochelatase
MTEQSFKDAIILFAHGSRDALWRRPIEAVANQVKQISPNTEVACAYLELTEPDLPTTVTRLVQMGVNVVRIVPMFLGVGRHAREDLPLLLQDLINQHPGVTFELRNAIGEEPELTRAMAQIALRPSAL